MPKTVKRTPNADVTRLLYGVNLLKLSMLAPDNGAPKGETMVSRIIPVDVFDLVIFGATGDLARRKILP
ncbi:MAG: hypothetical protein ACPGVJ_11140, partial [Mangrovicoccus sp.]